MPKPQSKPDAFPIFVMVVFGIFGVAMVFGLVRGVFIDRDRDEQERAEACEEDLSYLLQGESYGQAAADSHLWEDFRDECDQLDDLNAYLDARIVARQAGNDCTGLDLQLGAALARMLDSYGECDGVPLADAYEMSTTPEPEAVTEPTEWPISEAPASPAWPGGAAISWNDAIDYAGSVQRVCGPQASVRDDAYGIYLNVGRDYPDASRFTIVFWDYEWVEGFAPGTTVCTTGTIIDYGGVAQIHTSPENVEIWG